MHIVACRQCLANAPLFASHLLAPISKLHTHYLPQFIQGWHNNSIHNFLYAYFSSKQPEITGSMNLRWQVHLSDIVDTWLRNAIESRASCQGVCSHVLKVNPVTIRELRQFYILYYLVKAITSGSPYARVESALSIPLSAVGYNK